MINRLKNRFLQRYGKNSARGFPVTKIHVGCGPHNILEGWCNVDIRNFQGVDQVMDVTRCWPWKNVRYIFAEHFIEHLSLDNTLLFLVNAGNSLQDNGRIRLTTPSLEWVIKTHFSFNDNEKCTMDETLMINRAFHGWGHQFLYSKSFLFYLLERLGYCDILFFEYGESNDMQLKGLERHGHYSKESGFPNTWIIEAAKDGMKQICIPETLFNELENEYLKYIRSGH